MTVAHITFTQHLKHVLQDIALKKQTGLLRIEYVGEQDVERGEIFFESGNTVYARTEREMGEKALLHMVRWDKVYYSFFEAVQPPTRNRTLSGRSALDTRPLIPSTQKEEYRISVGRPTSSQGGKPLTLPAYTVPLRRLLRPWPSSIEEAVNLGVYAVFRILPLAATREIMSRMERQDRVIFMLLDGKRTVRQVAQLIHRSEPDVAHTLARLLKNGYIECVGSNSP
jgi:hypothetical protein